MFTQGYSALVSQLRPDAVPLPHVAGLCAARVESEALRAMNLETGTLPLSERIARPDAWQSIQRLRREALEALLAVAPTRATVARAADLACMIAEESSWAAEAFPIDDESRPAIDLQSAETAVLLGWTHRILGPQLNEISPLISSRIVNEVRQRILRPFIAHEDYPFMRAAGSCPLTILSDILLSCILLESDEARGGRVLKAALRRLDECCGAHGRKIAPLTESVADISAVTDLVALLRQATGGAFDLSQQLPAGEWLDELLFPWIDGEIFVDPAGDSMKPAISGCDLFRIGEAAGDGALTALGARIFRANGLPPATVTGRLLDLSARESLESEYGKPPLLRYAATHRNLLMTARMPGLCCALHAGGGHANAGDLLLFADSIPVLVDAGAHCAVRNVPALGGLEQLTCPDRSCAADFESREGRETMSVDLTYAYPAACGLRSYQRTVMTLREERTIRLVDAFEFSRPARIVFSFLTPVQPVVVQRAVRLGAVRLTWEGDLAAAFHPIDCADPAFGRLYQIELTVPEPVQRAFFTLYFERT